MCRIRADPNYLEICWSTALRCSHSHHWPKICWGIALTLRVVATADEAPIALYGASVEITCSHRHHWPKICWDIALTSEFLPKQTRRPSHCTAQVLEINCRHRHHWPKICWHIARTFRVPIHTFSPLQPTSVVSMSVLW